MHYVTKHEEAAASTPPLCISVKEAKKLLSVSHTTVYALLNSGQLDSTVVGGRRLIFTESVSRCAERGRQTSGLKHLNRGASTRLRISRIECAR